ncbi:MAG: hypothetical protein MJ053_03125 [Elusimicrobiaceae bacterium]|nr:hypothetical protein [Elusimicrobiaceae bacterium]
MEDYKKCFLYIGCTVLYLSGATTWGQSIIRQAGKAAADVPRLETQAVGGLSGNYWERSLFAGSQGSLRAQLERQAAQAMAAAEQHRLAFDGAQSIFRAQSMSALNSAGFSGTVFKTTYEGQEKIYGVIAAHALSTKWGDAQHVGQVFLGKVYVDGKFVTVPMKVVQISSPMMLDLALVEMRKQDEKLFVPFSLSHHTSVQVGDRLSLRGFTHVKVSDWHILQLSHLSDLQVTDNTPFTLRASLAGNWRERAGICGGVWLNQDNELVGIHVGSVSHNPQDIGFATHVKSLVQAHNNQGEGFFPFELNGKKVIDLRVDEYIPEFELFDAGNNRLLRWQFTYKFSYGDLKAAINEWSPRYLEFTVRRAYWNKGNNASRLVQNPQAKLDRYSTTYRYDLKEEKMVGQYQKATFTNYVRGLFHKEPKRPF